MHNNESHECTTCDGTGDAGDRNVIAHCRRCWRQHDVVEWPKLLLADIAFPDFEDLSWSIETRRCICGADLALHYVDGELSPDDGHEPYCPDCWGAGYREPACDHVAACDERCTC